MGKADCPERVCARSIQLNGCSRVASGLPHVSFANAATRDFDFNALPWEFVSSIDVFKSPNADLQEDGMSGWVNANTPRPPDIGKFSLSDSLQGSHESNAEEVMQRANFVYDDMCVGDLDFSATVAHSTSEQTFSKLRIENRACLFW